MVIKLSSVCQEPGVYMLDEDEAKHNQTNQNTANATTTTAMFKFDSSRCVSFIRSLTDSQQISPHFSRSFCQPACLPTDCFVIVSSSPTQPQLSNSVSTFWFPWLASKIEYQTSQKTKRETKEREQRMRMKDADKAKKMTRERRKERETSNETT